MSQTEWQRIWDLFFAALDHAPEARAQFLASACPEEPVRREVESLLAAHQRAPRLLDAPLGWLDEPDPEPVPDMIGRQVGRYRILRELGGGGMGTVYEAEQQSPVKRRVALKLIKLGMDTREVVARFEQERQALAIMSHTNIARVFDAGASDDGRPYFVMELVDGVPLPQYCDAQLLSIAERLRLFTAVCDGVQHAHHKGIVHRDLKPSNVLVAVEDGVPVPKVIDFGVAKAIHQPLGERSIHTHLGLMIGTPAYMSPEQFHPDGNQVDTRTDVYALAVLLYELLVGVAPFDIASLRRRGYAQMQRVICETEPRRPSAALSPIDGPPAVQAAARRGLSARELAAAVRGDLDWITLKGLAKQRSERYATPSEFAADINRHLAHEPILAHPPSAAYRARKFVRRHRLGVATAAGAALIVIGFAVAMTVQSLRLQRALAVAEREQSRAEQVSSFLVGLFKGADPRESGRSDLSARAILDAGAKRIGTGFDDQPEVTARLLETIGSAYRELGDYARARELLQQALEKMPQPADPVLAGIVHNALGELGQDQGDGQAAERHLREAVAARRGVKGGEAALAESLNNVAVLHLDRGEIKQGLAAGQQALALREQAFGRASEPVAQTMMVVGRAHFRLGEFAQADTLMREGIALKRKFLGEGHHSLGAALNAHAGVLRQLGRHDDAAVLLRESLAIYQRTLGPEHAYVATNLMNLGQTLTAAGHYAEAERAGTRALELLRRTPGPEHPTYAVAVQLLALTHYVQGRLALAESGFLAYLEVERKRRPGSVNVATAAHWLGTVLRVLGRLDEAQALVQEAIDLRAAALGESGVDVATSRTQLGLVHLARGELSAARTVLDKALDAHLRTVGPKHFFVASDLHALARVALAQRNVAEARDFLQRALAIQRDSLPQGHPAIASTVHTLADAERQAGQLDHAEALYGEALAARRKWLPAQHSDLADTLAGLAELLCTADRAAEARPLLAEARRILERSAPPAAAARTAVRSAAARCR